jgi:3-isopropylmalate/(R)-2-methylmalate dehydratase small subunit
MPKPADDQNTDDIVPARYLKEITFANMGDYAYYDERFKDGERVEDHPFNDPRYCAANILVAGANYGCGSSRQHAPEALYRYGIAAVICESVAEIFAGNSTNIGMPVVCVSRESIDNMVNLLEVDPEISFKIDLQKSIVHYRHLKTKLTMPEGRRQAFLNGTWDALKVLAQNEEGIARVEKEIPYLQLK